MVIIVCCFLFQIAGNTQYNLVKFNDIPTDNSDRPLEPVKVFRTQVSHYWGNVCYHDNVCIADIE